MSNVSIRECFSILNMSIVCIRNTARSKSIPLSCTHVDPYKFSIVHPPRKNHVNLLAYSDWAMRCIALLWCDILRPFMCSCSHVDRRWGHMSLSLLRHIMLLGAHGIVGVWVGEGLEEFFFLWFPVYWVYWNFRVCVIWVRNMHVAFHK